MRATVLFVVVAMCITIVLSQSSSNTVELMVSSSEKNTVWTLNQKQVNRFVQLFYRFGGDKKLNKLELAWYKTLGYQGFHINIVLPTGEQLIGRVYGNEYLETYLISTAVNINSKIRTLVMDEIFRDKSEIQQKYNGNSKQQRAFEAQYALRIESEYQYDFTSEPITPIRGPDNVTAYNPTKWNVSPVQSLNNCYDYSQDIRTDTFAQPGRGSGKKWQENSCDNVWAAAVRDGVIPLTNHTTQPESGAPSKGHYVALVMAPGFNFHWYKRDLDNTWSHKPGALEVRNVDNSGKRITDPQFCDRGWYTQFCGYMISVPSVETIN
jgi:hypothetical protein